MFSSVAFDVVIGLIFVFLLYSLFATIISEIIATRLSLRARNLREAIDRMLNDEVQQSGIIRFLNSLKLWRSVRSPVTNNFYAHPEIKYLGSQTLYRYPSAFKAISFSKTLLNVLFGDKPLTKELIDEKLNKDGALQPETLHYIRMLWSDSYGDIEKFKLQLENWFDRTMEQATEWYKRKIQGLLLVLGFMIAWFFNADTFAIVKKLSTDKDAREKMVQLASAYIENNRFALDTAAIATAKQQKEYFAKLDSLLVIKKRLDDDIAEAQTLVAAGSWLPDSVEVKIESKTGVRTFTPAVDAAALSLTHPNPKAGFLVFTCGDKLAHFFLLPVVHFFGFLTTAIAISLGAPFWFDLLNKLMRLRTSPKEEVKSPARSSTDNVSPLDREA